MSSLNLSLNNDFPSNRNKLHLKKNKSAVTLSIDNVKFLQRKIRINSPKSLSAMRKLGYKFSDLEYLPFNEYIKRNPNLIGKSKKTQQKIYSFIENLRNTRFQKIKDLRIKLKTQSSVDNTFKNDNLNNSVYNLRKIEDNKSHFLSNNSVDILLNTSLQKEMKKFERMKNKNETELVNKIQFELNKELIRKKNEYKIKQQKIRFINYQNELIKKQKEEEALKLEREREMQKKLEELELSQRLYNRKKYMEEIKKAKEDEKLQRQRQKEFELKHKEEEVRHLLFHQKLNEILEDQRQKILEKAKILEMKELNKKKQIEKKNKAQQELNLKKSIEKRVQIQQTLRNYEIKIEEIRKHHELKEKQHEEKEKRLEKIAQKENEIKKENAKKKEEEIKSILEKNKAIRQQKIDDYNQKQKLLEKKRELFEKNNELIRLEKFRQKEEKEQKIKNTLNKNKILMSQRKNKIIKEIKLKEYNTQRVWKKKQENNERIEDFKLSKNIEKEFKVKEMEQQKQYMINDAKMKMYNRDKRLKNFLKQKYIINEQKKMFSDEINKQKKLYSEKMQNLFSKNTIKKKDLNQIKNIFSHSQQITNVIDKFGQLIKKNEE